MPISGMKHAAFTGRSTKARLKPIDYSVDGDFPSERNCSALLDNCVTGRDGRKRLSVPQVVSRAKKVAMTPPAHPSAARDRFEVYRFFNGLSAEGQEGLRKGYTPVPLVKTFLLEHVSSRNGVTPKAPAKIFRRLGLEIRHLDETFLELKAWEKADPAPRLRIAGYLEQYDERFFAFHTAEKAAKAKRQVQRWIGSSPDLDFTWFSGQLLQSLWDRDVSCRGDALFSKLVFRHESVFDLPEDLSQETELEEEEVDQEEGLDDERDDRPERDRRRVRSEIRDRIGPIRKALRNLQGNYPPLNALYALRLPSRIRRGGHDLYQMGQVTNRSDSFEDHRNTVRYLYRTYKSLLENTENSAWLTEERIGGQRAVRFFRGVPLIINFAEELPETTFNRWVELAFKKRNLFRLWGDPVRLGPRKVHVYGADRHLWQPIHLEMTAKRVVAILPKGTCGNTFHRLVTNVQRYVCPKIDVWLGAKPFQQVIDEVPAESDNQ
jgi:hypothetical protein